MRIWVSGNSFLINQVSDITARCSPSSPPMPPGRQGTKMQMLSGGSYGGSSEMMNSPDVSNIYERVEEIVEGMIDEKWDELLGEVKKIIEWKEKFEEEQRKLTNELGKLKEDFQILHQGVLGKLEDYDTRMTGVDTELKAVGKIFKDVVPQFVENVKELSFITEDMKKGKK